MRVDFEIDTFELELINEALSTVHEKGAELGFTDIQVKVAEVLKWKIEQAARRAWTASRA